MVMSGPDARSSSSATSWLRDAHAQRAAADGVEDHRQRPRPPAPDDLLSAGVDVDPALELRLGRGHEDQRHADRTVLDDEDPLLRELVGGVGAEAVDGVGRKGDHPPAPQQLRRARESVPVGLQDHASRTRAWPPRSRWTRWLANAAAAACSADVQDRRIDLEQRAAVRAGALPAPTASDRPDQSAGASGRPREKVSESPGCAVPGPAEPAAAGGLRARRPAARARRWPARARRISSLLLESISGRISTVKPGSSGATASQMASASQRIVMPAALGRQQGAAAVLAAAPARILRLQLLRVRLVDDQAVVVVELFAGLDVAQALDEHPAVLLVGFAVRVARMVDPARGIAAVGGVDHAVFIDVEVEGMVRVFRIPGMAPLRLLPRDDLAHIFDERLALGNVLQREDALAVHARLADLDSAVGPGLRLGICGGLGTGHLAEIILLTWIRTRAQCACAYVREEKRDCKNTQERGAARCPV